MVWSTKERKKEVSLGSWNVSLGWGTVSERTSDFVPVRRVSSPHLSALNLYSFGLAFLRITEQRCRLSLFYLYKVIHPSNPITLLVPKSWNSLYLNLKLGVTERREVTIDILSPLFLWYVSSELWLSIDQHIGTCSIHWRDRLVTVNIYSSTSNLQVGQQWHVEFYYLFCKVES